MKSKASVAASLTDETIAPAIILFFPSYHFDHCNGMTSSFTKGK
jgi:hypothetical protein